SMESMIAEMVREYKYPVAYGVPVGHVDHNIPLVEGVTTTLSVTVRGTVISQK
ncbi:MAG: LD-carboxypeptidase, partial [Paramuribaculum sp.]|nr:LD-carboxypeptidase [Paramuribaculum sp.]